MHVYTYVTVNASWDGCQLNGTLPVLPTINTSIVRILGSLAGT